MTTANRHILSSVLNYGRDGHRLSLVSVPVGETFCLAIYGCVLSSRDDQGKRLKRFSA